MAANGLKTKAYKCLFSSHWQPFNFGWSNCLSLKHVSWLLSFSILPNIFRILAILFQKLAKTGGLEWLSHYNCRYYYTRHWNISSTMFVMLLRFVLCVLLRFCKNIQLATVGTHQRDPYLTRI